MKALLIVLSLILFSLQVSLVHAEDKKKEVEYIVISTTPSTQTRPHKPVKRENVYCCYENGIVCIAFNESNGSAQLIISNEENFIVPVILEFDTSIPFSYYIGECSCPVEIRIMTDTHEYIGVIEPKMAD